MIEISEPVGSAVLRDGVMAKGRGRAFENSLLVQVREFSGRVVGEAIAHIDAEVGQIGTWEVRLELENPTVTHQGRVYACTTSPKDGSIVADDMVVVVWLAGSR